MMLVAAGLVFSGAIPKKREAAVDLAEYGPPEFSFRIVSFADLPGWSEDNQAEAAPAFLRSCARLAGLSDDAPANPLEALGPHAAAQSISGLARDWRPACAGARGVLGRLYRDPAQGAREARAFFEAYFTPLQIVARREPLVDGAQARRRAHLSTAGLFTGYFEPAYPAARARDERFSAPLYARPADLVMVDLGRFRETLAGQRIAGFVRDGTLHPYADHSAINAGALADAADILAWLDPNDLFFLQIQGSGRLRFADGETARVGYDGQNGHPYAAIGRELVRRGAMALEDVTMQSIRAWLDAAAPEAAQELREANPSYVFFRRLDDLPEPALGPLGAEGVQLTPGRSLAVDRRYTAMGAPVWVALTARADGAPARARLYIAQDTGGAITGPVRGDIFIGAGDAAGEAAGVLRAEGEMYVLIPAAIADRIAGQRRIAASGE